MAETKILQASLNRNDYEKNLLSFLLFACCYMLRDTDYHKSQCTIVHEGKAQLTLQLCKMNKQVDPDLLPVIAAKHNRSQQKQMQELKALLEKLKKLLIRKK